MKTLLLVTFVLTLHVMLPAAAMKGSCRAETLCCDGEDGDCMSQTAPARSYWKDVEAVEPCYCDHGCIEVGDCCPDFKEYCGVYDCQVSEWSSWSDCSASCGHSVSVRKRQIVRPEANGGEQCPELREERACRVKKQCIADKMATVSAHGETAMILPGKYAIMYHQSLKNRYEVRANLRSFRPTKGQRYCAVFRVDKSSHSCQRSKDSKALIPGHEVCVICDSKAQRGYLGGRCAGHGAQDKPTKFKIALNTKCHGKWTRVRFEEECPCQNGPDFTFI